MPIDYNQQNFSKKDAQRKNNFAVVFGDPALANLSLFLENFPFPKITNSVQSIKAGNVTSKYAGSFQAVDSVSATFKEFLTRESSLMLSKWRNQVGNLATGHMGRVATYKKDGFLYKLPPGNISLAGVVEDVSVQKWAMEGCWLSSYSEGEYSTSDDGALVLVQATLEIDKFYPSFSLA